MKASRCSAIVIFNANISKSRPVAAGASQGSILDPLLYSIYIAYIPTSLYTIISTFVDDTSILSCPYDPLQASEQLQSNLNVI